MGAIATQMISLSIVYSTINSGSYQRKHQSSASLSFVWGIHRWPVNSSHKWPVTRKMFLFDDVIMNLEGLGNVPMSTACNFRVTSWYGKLSALLTQRECYPTLAREFQGFRVWGKFVFRTPVKWTIGDFFICQPEQAVAQNIILPVIWAWDVYDSHVTLQEPR